MQAASGTTNLAIYRALSTRYPDRDRRQMLLDLIETRGDKGKWFAAAKDPGFLDVAIECAPVHGADPSTLVRAARDFGEAEPRFAATVALLAMQHLLGGGGYDPPLSDATEAVGYLFAAAQRIGATGWAQQELAGLMREPCSPGREAFREAMRAGLSRHDATSTGLEAGNRAMPWLQLHCKSVLARAGLPIASHNKTNPMGNTLRHPSLISNDDRGIRGCAVRCHRTIFGPSSTRRMWPPLLRQLRLPCQDLDDLRQDLLADLIARLRGFDPERGSLGAFSGIVLANRSTRIANKVKRRRDHSALAGADGANRHPSTVGAKFRGGRFKKHRTATWLTHVSADGGFPPSVLCYTRSTGAREPGVTAKDMGKPCCAAQSY